MALRHKRNQCPKPKDIKKKLQKEIVHLHQKSTTSSKTALHFPSTFICSTGKGPFSTCIKQYIHVLFPRNLESTFCHSCRQTHAKSCFLQLSFDPIFTSCVTHTAILALESPSRTLIPMVPQSPYSILVAPFLSWCAASTSLNLYVHWHPTGIVSLVQILRTSILPTRTAVLPPRGTAFCQPVSMLYCRHF